MRVNIKLYLDTKRTERTLLDAALHYIDFVCHLKYTNLFNSTDILMIYISEMGLSFLEICNFNCNKWLVFDLVLIVETFSRNRSLALPT